MSLAEILSKLFVVFVWMLVFIVIPACISRKYFGANGNWWNPLLSLREGNGRTSLSKSQVFVFTFVVLSVVSYWSIYPIVEVLWLLDSSNLPDGTQSNSSAAEEYSGLPGIDQSLLYLLGIGIGGTVGGRLVNTQRDRVKGENFAWAKSKNWIKNDFTKSLPERQPRLADLVTTDTGFEVSRFQAITFSITIALAILIYGLFVCSTPSQFQEFRIDPVYLALIGISQGAYVLGKTTGGSLVAELDSALDEVRRLELNLQSALIKDTQYDDRTDYKARLDHARSTAEYSDYCTKQIKQQISFMNLPELVQLKARENPHFLSDVTVHNRAFLGSFCTQIAQCLCNTDVMQKRLYVQVGIIPSVFADLQIFVNTFKGGQRFVNNRWSISVEYRT